MSRVRGVFWLILSLQTDAGAQFRERCASLERNHPREPHRLIRMSREWSGWGSRARQRPGRTFPAVASESAEGGVQERLKNRFEHPRSPPSPASTLELGADSGSRQSESLGTALRTGSPRPRLPGANRGRRGHLLWLGGAWRERAHLAQCREQSAVQTSAILLHFEMCWRFGGALGRQGLGAVN